MLISLSNWGMFPISYNQMMCDSGFAWTGVNTAILFPYGFHLEMPG
jgi:hypothetical protein